MTGRNLFLGITQDETCVTWSFLTSLREKYNLVWDMLNACGKAEGEKYGATGKAQELANLPSIEGFFRVELNVVDTGGGTYSVTPAEIKFICTGGEFYTRINDSNYTYFTSGVPYSVILKDECNNCSVFGLQSYLPAMRELGCPVGGTFTLYDGWYELDIGAASSGCGGMLAWADNLDILSEMAELFDIVKFGTSPPECHEIKECCCNLFATAHYESVEVGLMAIRFLDIYVDGDGQPAIGGNISTLIRATDLQEIQDRVVSDIVDIKLNRREPLCDECGPDPDYGSTGIGPGCYLVPSGNLGHAVRCSSDWTWADISVIKFVTGVGGYDTETGCVDCTEVDFMGIICACTWERLAGVMDFIHLYGCVVGCAEPMCPDESSARIDVTITTEVGNSYSCGIWGETESFGSVTKNFSAVVSGCPPDGSSFTCEWHVTTSVSGSLIVGDPGECSDPTETENTKAEECHCAGDGYQGSVGSTTLVSTSYSGAVTKAALIAFAYSVATSTVVGPTTKCTIDCNYCSPSLSTSVSLESSAFADIGSGSISRQTAVFTMVGDHIDATLHWTDTLYNSTGGFISSTPRVASLNSGSGYSATVTPVAGINQTCTSGGFYITIP